MDFNDRLHGVCALLVLIWVPTVWLWPSIDGWVLVINTLTSTVTFLPSLYFRTLRRAPRYATQRKLNALAEALAELMDSLDVENPDLRRSRDELTAAVGVEQRESTKCCSTGLAHLSLMSSAICILHEYRPIGSKPCRWRWLRLNAEREAGAGPSRSGGWEVKSRTSWWPCHTPRVRV